jgi:hypothetical protein
MLDLEKNIFTYMSGCDSPHRAQKRRNSADPIELAKVKHAGTLQYERVGRKAEDPTQVEL